MAKENIMRLTTAEKLFIDYIRKKDPFETREIMNQLEKALLKAKIYVAEEEEISRKEAEEKEFKYMKGLIEVLGSLAIESENVARKKFQ